MRQANKWRLGGILVLLALSGLLIYAFPINLGLDLRGGVHVVLEGQDTPEVKVNAETMRKAKLVIERRVNALGVAEPIIQLKGERQIIVDMPGLRDQQRAIELIGKTAVLEFRDPEGRTVLTGAKLVDAWLSRDNYG
ncbi:MAG: protein translocase subunit SecD, partial [Bacillota bacterium]|nr:protein translocase subunit SecD [Bacillota bacterium]